MSSLNSQRNASVALSIILGFVGSAFAQAPPLPNDVATLDLTHFVPRKPTEEMIKARKGKAVPTEEELLTFEWTRPANVKYVLIAGCGGGAGGSKGEHWSTYENWKSISHQVGGSGGDAATYQTTWIGPLKGQTYKIVLGNGGLSGKEGSKSFFVGEDYAIEFPGASAPTRRAEGSSQPGSGVHVAPSREMPPAGKAAVDPRRTNLTGSGGDASPFGAGGDGGEIGQPGKDAEGLCAGGGGGAYAGRNSLPGGRGGDGYLHLVPLADMTVVADQVRALVRSLQEPTTKEGSVP